MTIGDAVCPDNKQRDRSTLLLIVNELGGSNSAKRKYAATFQRRAFRRQAIARDANRRLAFCTPSFIDNPVVRPAAIKSYAISHA